MRSGYRFIMRTRILLVAAIMATPLAAVPSAGAEVAQGCEVTATGYVCLYGPIMVRRGENFPEPYPLVEFPAPDEPGFITRARATLVDGDGVPIPRHAIHLHHVVWLNPNERDMTCPSGFWRERFFASGKERTALELPAGFGYHWDNQPNDVTGTPTWAINYHLDGHHSGVQETWIKLTIGFTSEADAPDMTSITPVWLDVDNCSDSEFNIRKGDGRRGVARRSWTYDMPASGRFVALAGHLHDGGIELRLRNLTAGRGVFTSKPTYRKGTWDLRKMSSYSGVPGKRASAGDSLRLTAVYDSTRNRPAVMGIMMGALALDV
jgi:hypothetical protein